MPGWVLEAMAALLLGAVPVAFLFFGALLADWLRAKRVLRNERGKRVKGDMMGDLGNVEAVFDQFGYVVVAPLGTPEPGHMVRTFRTVSEAPVTRFVDDWPFEWRPLGNRRYQVFRVAGGNLLAPPPNILVIDLGSTYDFDNCPFVMVGIESIDHARRLIAYQAERQRRGVWKLQVPAEGEPPLALIAAGGASRGWA